EILPRLAVDDRGGLAAALSRRTSPGGRGRRGARRGQAADGGRENRLAHQDRPRLEGRDVHPQRPRARLRRGRRPHRAQAQGRPQEDQDRPRLHPPRRLEEFRVRRPVPHPLQGRHGEDERGVPHRSPRQARGQGRREGRGARGRKRRGV
ncbi:MAG: hypothetical protein AVDCRST_MAG64-1317, partial [uncultured Phycisphaerae bacterium]